MKLNYLKELDGIRAIAAIMVMIFHFFQHFITNNSTLLLIQKVSIFGRTGVSLFFVLSGFLITRILLVTKDTNRYFYNFYIRRILRIFPLYYLFLALYYFIFPVIYKVDFSNFNQQIFYWIYMQDFAMTFNWPSIGPDHFWSLAVEEHFYLFWPFLIYYLSNRKIVFSIFILVLISIFVRFYFTNHQIEIYYFTFSRMDELAIGAFLAILELEKKLTIKQTNKYLFLFSALLIPSLVLWQINNASGNSTLQVFKYIVLSIIYFTFIAYVITVKESHFLKRFLQIKPLTYTGKISYGLYVYHPFCFWLFKHYFNTDIFIIDILGCFLVTYILSSLSYYLFESKVLSLKQYFEYDRSSVKS